MFMSHPFHPEDGARVHHPVHDVQETLSAFIEQVGRHQTGDHNEPILFIETPLRSIQHLLLGIQSEAKRSFRIL